MFLLLVSGCANEVVPRADSAREGRYGRVCGEGPERLVGRTCEEQAAASLAQQKGEWAEILAEGKRIAATRLSRGELRLMAYISNGPPPLGQFWNMAGVKCAVPPPPESVEPIVPQGRRNARLVGAVNAAMAENAKVAVQTGCQPYVSDTDALLSPSSIRFPTEEESGGTYPFFDGSDDR
jgi:hypothetical protein